MSHQEKRAWIMAVVTAGAYGAYATIVLGRAQGTPLVDVDYVSTLVWSIVGAIIASIVLDIATSMFAGRDANKKDLRDREIGRLGDFIGQSLVIAGATAALGMAMAEWNYFWIANVIYLGFVLSSILGSVTKIVAYRRGFQSW